MSCMPGHCSESRLWFFLSQMEVRAAGEAMRDRRLYLWLGKLDEVLHTSCIREHFLRYAAERHSGESVLFWMHACVYELAHPIPFTLSGGKLGEVTYPSDCVGPGGAPVFESLGTRAIAVAHARYLWKRFVEAGAPQQVVCGCVWLSPEGLLTLVW